MLKYNNNHIFTGYLKQLLSSFYIPSCRVYTKAFADYFTNHGEEDPRVLKSFDNINDDRLAVRINYLKNDEIYHYYWKPSSKDTQLGLANATWKRSANVFYNTDKFIPGLNRCLNSPGITYDTKTHEYLGEYLRFIRDYYNVNLMSLYNCFTDKIYNNVYFNFVINPTATADKQVKVLFNSQDPTYKLYALPVKLFSEYTIAIDCDQGIEMFCGLYNTSLDSSVKAENLAMRTYKKVNKTIFKQPFVYDKLSVKYWSDDTDFKVDEHGNKSGINTKIFTRWDIANREQDLKLFIKVPISCRSSITILEGDYRNFNDCKYIPSRGVWKYTSNRSILNFSKKDKVDLDNYDFKPISKLQLLEFNTGESYPFADRLIEYLCGSVITPIDEVTDNIKRVQKVMNANGYYFKVDGVWEDRMKNIVYDYIMNSGPVEAVLIGDDERDMANYEKKIMSPTTYAYKTKLILVDKHQGMHQRLGHSSKSTLYDVLGYVDKDAEKWYASWTIDKTKTAATVDTSLQNVDIYNGIYDI